MADVGVAMSGGGHRASLFGLGVLMYLADAGVNRDVTSIASVSGGSITNGYVGQTVDFRAVSGPEFEQAVAPYAKQLAQRGTLFATRGTTVYLVVAAITVLAAIVGPWFVPAPGFVQGLVFVAALLAWMSLVFGRRGSVCARAFATTVFSPTGKPTLLRDVHTNVDHVICATELQSAEQVYFSGSFVYGYRFGKGVPADLPLHVAVQASSCLPGAFPPRWLPTAPHGFQYSTPDCPPPEDRPASKRNMVLVDGGVYDNMADQWGQGFAGRKRCWPTIAQDAHEPEVLIVANASAGLEWTPFNRARIPAFGEIAALLKDKDVLYDQTTAVRRQGLVGRFDRAALTGKGLRGALVHIPESPFVVPKAFEADATWPDRATRAGDVLKALGNTEAEWAETAKADSTVGTVLSKLGTDVSARLIHHAYVLTMANLHVILGTPLLPMPDRQRFVALVS